MLDGRTAIVTGGTNGIGRAIALAYADHGADVLITDRKKQPRHADEPTHELVEQRGQRGLFVEADLSDPVDIEHMFDVVTAEVESLDVLVNNAGISMMDDSVLDLSLKDWQLIQDVNLTGTFLCCKSALPALIASEGCIVNLSSAAGLRASTDGAAYCSSKAGVTNLTRQIAVDYSDQGIRANSIHPSPIETEGLALLREEDNAGQAEKAISDVPMGRVGEPGEVASAAVFLASEYASYVNGHSLVVDGGLMAKYY